VIVLDTINEAYGQGRHGITHSSLRAIPHSLARVAFWKSIDEEENGRIALDSKFLGKLCVYRGIDLGKGDRISLEN
jgi:hypothetical protein